MFLAKIVAQLSSSLRLVYSVENVFLFLSLFFFFFFLSIAQLQDSSGLEIEFSFDSFTSERGSAAANCRANVIALVLDNRARTEARSEDVDSADVVLQCGCGMVPELRIHYVDRT